VYEVATMVFIIGAVKFILNGHKEIQKEIIRAMAKEDCCCDNC